MGSVQAQISNPMLAASAEPPTWQHCALLADDREARLSCFDHWVAQQPVSTTPGNAFSESSASAQVESPPAAPPPLTITIKMPEAHDCKNPRLSEVSRFWELEAGSDCGTFGIRGYRPISLSWIGADSVNPQPSSPAPGHTAATVQPYSPNELRIQLSVRTKLAQGLLTQGKTKLRDSLWFAYTQQSYWQLFNGELSRPFRSTDHEPEITYVYPTDAPLPLGWRLRYSGVRLVHQSNGQSLPLSRSWNRLALMTGMEKGDAFGLQAQVWKRLNEDSSDDDNPSINDLIGRAEISGIWNTNRDNTLIMTLRHSLAADANGSIRLQWLKNIGDNGIPSRRTGLRFHTQLFTGYGDSLVDYNRRRTVLSIGLSLVDW